LAPKADAGLFAYKQQDKGQAQTLVGKKLSAVSDTPPEL
jgi:hypothetical protein